MFDNMKPQLEESPKPRSRKYFGMTTTQLGILAGMGGAACFLFVIAGCLFLRGGLGSLASAPQPTPVPQSTATPFVIPTITPTATLTPVPYEMLIPDGWLQFKTALVEIWLPKGFKQQKIKPSDAVTGTMTMDLEIVGSTSGSSLYPVIVLISYEPLAVGSLDAYVDGLPAQLSTDIRVAAKRKLTINSVDAILVLLEMKVDGDEVNDQVYVMLDGGTVWIIQYIAQINEFYQMLPTFEQSIKTFRPVR